MPKISELNPAAVTALIAKLGFNGLSPPILDGALAMNKTVGLEDALAAIDTELDGKQPAGSYADAVHTHATGDITALAEFIRDTIGATLVQGANVTLTVNDGADTITIAASGGGGGSDPWTYVKLGSDFSTSATTTSNVTGFEFTPAANTRYEVEGMLLMRTALNTTGPRPGFGWPTGCNDGVGRIDAASSASANIVGMGNIGAAVQSANTGLPNATNSFPALLWATFDTGASPGSTFRIQLASEIAASNVTLKAGSWFRYRIIP